MNIDPSIIRAFAPTGRLRASINLGNPVLASRQSADAPPTGISVDLAHELARRLQLELEFAIFETARKSVEAVTEGRADIGFFAIDPVRGAGIAFTAPYILIEGRYLVRQESPITRNDQVDVASNRIAVGQGTAYDLFLTREIQAAKLVRAASSQVVVKTFLDNGLEVAAGVKQVLEIEARNVAGLRLLDEPFMVIQQAMGIPKDRGSVAARFLGDFIEEMKASGFIGEAMTRHGVAGASVAPPA
ncbi:amino acid ABC transporter substrate-binding protein (PAAT family) [Trinickia symbiotica]|uniref:ABC transporter substrate-binding protein n=1 Tax=Trinickia symbiotica TaxID=863227 RepID=A0A2N7X4W0_9BURK|nr:transporter substrate-binding domain-containing protein [Trinickia symbiotica]PMS36796.1 ABC transporter substrate-binding protein [Trinickia symbiotica]PPK46247.1 amino acid ABC transporter substrate-binding protein (PAAT family) [Trinickia symbiotica]